MADRELSSLCTAHRTATTRRQVGGSKHSSSRLLAQGAQQRFNYWFVDLLASALNDKRPICTGTVAPKPRSLLVIAPGCCHPNRSLGTCMVHTARHLQTGRSHLATAMQKMLVKRMYAAGSTNCRELLSQIPCTVHYSAVPINSNGSCPTAIYVTS